MNFESLRNWCLRKKGVTEEFPFDEDTLVFKVMGKMFALTNLEWSEPAVNLKCDPERAIALREIYEAVRPGYHMNKKHWNTVAMDDSINDSEFREMIDHSYDLVVKGLKKSDRMKLAEMSEGTTNV